RVVTPQLGTMNISNRNGHLALVRGTIWAVIDQRYPRQEETRGRILLPPGEGGPTGRMRAPFSPSPAASRHPLREGEGHTNNQFRICEPAVTRIRRGLQRSRLSHVRQVWS